MSRKQPKNWQKRGAVGGKKLSPARDAIGPGQNSEAAAQDSVGEASDSVDGFADSRAGAPATRSTAGGCLYLVGTPIGNLEDMTLRGVRILKEVSQIACEDTRHTAKLLQHYGIEKPLVSYHEHNEMTRAAELVVALEQGTKIALVSDAGMPLVSDPGHRLVAMCCGIDIAVVPIPGPSALLAALSASGLPNEEFLFVGFLPARSGERRRALERLRIEDRTIIFYEAPHRIAETIADAFEVLGDRPACLAREVTKLHEEFRRGRLSELTATLEERPARGGDHFADRRRGCGRGAGPSECGLDAEFVGAGGRVDSAGETGSQGCVEIGGKERGDCRVARAYGFITRGIG